MFILIIVNDGDIETSYHPDERSAEAHAIKVLAPEWPSDEPHPTDFDEAYNLSRSWSYFDIRIEQCPSN